MEFTRRGVMLVLASPSGAGKSSISRALFEDDPNIALSVSVTTRARRTDEIDGKSVVKVDQSDDDGTSTGYVLEDGKHYLVKIERTDGDQPGTLEFTDFNKEFDVTAPAEDDVIDLSSLQ